MAKPMVALDFGEVLAIEGADIPVLNMVDVASTYQVVFPITGTKSEDAAQAFMRGWVQRAGAPRFVIADLDPAFKDQFLTQLDQLAVHIRRAAGQAHWQNSVAERQGETWKAIWKKHTEDNLILKDEAPEAIAAINTAKNSLRNRSGTLPDNGSSAPTRGFRATPLTPRGDGQPRLNNNARKVCPGPGHPAGGSYGLLPGASFGHHAARRRPPPQSGSLTFRTRVSGVRLPEHTTQHQHGSDRPPSWAARVLTTGLQGAGGAC